MVAWGPSGATGYTPQQVQYYYTGTSCTGDPWFSPTSVVVPVTNYVDSFNWGELEAALTRAEQRKRDFDTLRSNIRFRRARCVLPRPQLPIGFSACAPLARSNC